MSNRITTTARCIDCRAVFGQPHAGQLRCLECYVALQARLSDPALDHDGDYLDDRRRYCVICDREGVHRGYNVCSECMGDLLDDME